MSFKIEGLDGLEKQLKKMQRAAKEMDGTHTYSFKELFPSSFMREHTNCSSIDDFFGNCGFPASTLEEIAAIPDAEFDEYVEKSSEFESWEDMKETAAQALIARKLGF